MTAQPPEAAPARAVAAGWASAATPAGGGPAAAAAGAQQQQQEEPVPSEADVVFRRCLAIAQARLSDDNLLRDEFRTVKELDRFIDQSTYTAQSNGPKNRYTNVHPYDHNRVHLGPTGAAGGYINASRITITDALGFQMSYIAAQGPTPTTVPDFWRMVWEQRVGAVVMVTNLVENHVAKCALYFPGNEGERLSVGGLQVLLIQREVVSAALTMRRFEVSEEKAAGRGALTVLHYHYRAWPDHGTPEESTPIRQISQALDQVRGPSHGGQPVLVHCSAGIGRTGTFCAIDVLRHRLDALQRQLDHPGPQRAASAGESSGGSGSSATAPGSLDPPQPRSSSWPLDSGAGGVNVDAVLDVPGLVHALRQQRDGMVQSQEQYSFIYQALVEELLERSGGLVEGQRPRPLCSAALCMPARGPGGGGRGEERPRP